MGVSQIGGATSSSPVKSVQRGEALASGNITISAVDPNKTMVRSFSTGSSGTVAATGNITGTLSPASTISLNVSGIYTNPGGWGSTGNANPTYSGTRAISGGTTSLTSAVNGVYLSNSTTLVATGPCRYEVVEFN